MGNEESKISFPTQEVIVLVGKNITTIPPHIPPTPMLAYLNLSNNNIQNLPPDLKSLKNLILARNGYDSIPQAVQTSLFTYSSLEALDLSNNNLTSLGNILSNLPSLRRINLFGNKFETIPQLANTSLQVIDLANNNLKHFPSLPETIVALNVEKNQISEIELDNSSFKINNLAKLCAASNRIIKFTCLGVLKIVTLDISRNKISKLPDFNRCFDKLQQINISSNLVPSIPQFPPQITEFFASNNKIASIPESFSQYTFLTTADLYHNMIKSIKVQLPGSLQSLILADNQIKDSVPSTINGLNRMFMMNNQLKEIPVIQGNSLCEYYLSRNLIEKIEISNFSKNVTRVDLSHCNLSVLPPDLFTIPTLTHLFLGYNKIKELPQTLKNSTSIILLQLSGNKNINVDVDYPETLEQLFISNCNLKSLPTSLEKLVDFIELDASCNELREFSLKLPEIKKLILSCNKIKKFPENIESVELLDLSVNRIADIPEKLSLIRLKELDISYNSIKTIPAELALNRLNILKVQKNPISQQIGYTNFPKLSYIDLSSIPAEVAEPSPEVIMYSSAPGFCNSLTHNFVISDKSCAYSLWKGLREIMEDGIIFRCDKTQRLFSIIDGRGGAMSCQYISSKIPKLSRDRSDILDEESLKQIHEKICQSCKKKQILTVPDFSIVYINNNEIFMLLTGHVDIVIINDEKCELLQSFTTKDKPRDLLSLNRTHGPVPTSYTEGDSLVYNTVIPPSIVKRPINEKDKWLLILSVSVLDVMRFNEVCSIAKNLKNADEIAVSIRNATYSGMSTDNISVICIKLQESQKQ
ncbi:Leucine Rich Repeat family protein [Trichomonas vaginalis G3]|uniref:Leucine Rich Repeat family protein n=1 Tax=Trichomonas vaginalis (strain ATCC PRA-98 / G3) TaxID=412133 RepID=A2DBK1_TRIV3|nr:uncharacterized protein TVAGG3_0381960 [Trichomonas vaginalis G3]EAY22204.1 Leucine Rich Repeat family protein [Trichomonas vaginalis G3]KAI5533338.1 leucine-rich repeats, outliers [Trichomonas vaginalis G3]|eukprot:XP_001583190.1 hypothetical protein [Trichomonas vaginalis G3]